MRSRRLRDLLLGGLVGAAGLAMAVLRQLRLPGAWLASFVCGGRARGIPVGRAGHDDVASQRPLLLQPVALRSGGAALNPGSALAHNHCRVALAKISGREAEAIAQLREALRQEPGNPVIHDRLGQVLTQMPGSLTEAIAHCAAASRLKG